MEITSSNLIEFYGVFYDWYSYREAVKSKLSGLGPIIRDCCCQNVIKSNVFGFQCIKSIGLRPTCVHLLHLMVTFFGINLCTWMLRHDPVCVSINGYVWCMFMCLAKVYYWNFISIIGTETLYGSIIIVSHFQCVPMLSAKLGHWSISSTCTRYTYTF